MTKVVNIAGQVRLILTAEEGAGTEKKHQIHSISGDIDAEKAGIVEEAGLGGEEAGVGQHQEVAVENHALYPLVGVAGNVIQLQSMIVASSK